MKKFISIFVIAVLLVTVFATNAFAAGTNLYVSEVETVAGESATVSVNISGNTGFSSASIYLDYNSEYLTITSITPVMMGNGLSANPANGKTSFSSSSLLEGDGVLFTVTFAVKEGTPIDAYPVTISTSKLINNLNGERIDLEETVTGGSVAVVCPHNGGVRTEIENKIDATCKEAGSYDEVVYCSACGKEVSRTAKVIDKLTTHTHANPVRENEKAPTCKEAGSYDEVVYCSVCGKEISRTTKSIDKLTTHTPADPVRENEKAATCKEAGSYDEVVYCSVCGKEISRNAKVIDKLTTHTPAAAVRENEKAATCKEAGSYDEVVYCSVCGEEISRTAKVIDKLTTHTPDEPIREDEVPATCSKAGSYVEVINCSVCGEEISRTEKVIEKLAHTPGKAVEENKVAATCKKAGSVDLVVYCSVCNEEISRVKQTIEKLPHVDTNKDDKCDVCGGDMDDEEPKNGDITPYPVFFLIALMAVMATAYGLKRKFDV